MQALVDKLKNEQAIAAATHAYPAASCPVRTLSAAHVGIGAFARGAMARKKAFCNLPCETMGSDLMCHVA